MSAKFQQFRSIIVVLVTAAIIGVMAVARITETQGAIAQGFPPAATPHRGTQPANAQRAIDFQAFSGNGIDTAPVALQSALPQLPFKARLPEYLPNRMQLRYVNTYLIGADKKHANLDVYYEATGTSAEHSAVHIYQANQSLDGKKVSEQASAPQPIIIGADVWTYRRLTFPQPNGSTYQLHNLYRTFDDGVYVDLDIRVGADSEASLAELKKVIASLR